MQKQKLGGILAWIRPQMHAVFITMSNVNRDIASLEPDAVAAAAAIDKVFEPLNKMVDGLSTLYDAEKGQLGGILQWLRGHIWAVFFTFSNIYSDVRAMEGDARAGIATAANVIGEVEDVLNGLGLLYAASKDKGSSSLMGVMNDLAYATGTMFIVNLRRGLQDARAAIYNELADLTNIFRGWMQYTTTQFYALGQSIPQAIANGIYRSIPILDAALRAIAQRTADAERPYVTPPWPVGGGSWDSGGNNQTINVTVNNPIGETSDHSITRQMRNLATVGVL
jgi:hypothetical protein